MTQGSISFVLVLSLSSLVLSATACQAIAPSQQVNALGANGGVISAEKYEMTSRPLIGTKAIRLGGFSGLTFEGLDPETGEWLFTTTTDRGPNGLPTKTRDGRPARPFMDPDFRVQWIRFGYQPETKKLTLRERTVLTDQQGHEISGMPNFVGDNENGILTGDEVPVDASGNILPTDPMGLDTESVALDRDGTYWMTEEYRPSILHFTAAGRLITRWSPVGSPTNMGTAILPEHFKKRRLNRGFEGVALQRDSIFAFLQSGFKGEDESTRILQVDKASGASQAEFIYPYESTPAGWAKVDKISDAISIGNGIFYVIEQNESTGADAFRRIYKIDTKGATNILGSSDPGQAFTAASFCKKERPSIEREVCVLPVQKELVADLAELGMRDSDKAEGIAIVDSTTLAIVNDNDFGANPTYFMVIHLPVPMAIEQ